MLLQRPIWIYGGKIGKGVGGKDRRRERKRWGGWKGRERKYEEEMEKWKGGNAWPAFPNF